MKRIPSRTVRRGPRRGTSPRSQTHARAPPKQAQAVAALVCAVAQPAAAPASDAVMSNNQGNRVPVEELVGRPL